MARPQTRGSKRPVTPDILTCYENNIARLMTELTKDPRDPGVLTTIRAYHHIVRALEENYEIGLPPVEIPAEL